jgi:2-oxo-4-hydroxy-4-carboxy-5-ureidoimidazoline decarboxylase
MPEKMRLEEVNRLGIDEFVSRLGSVFENSPWVAERAWGSRPFGGFSELYGAMIGAVDEVPREQQIDLIRAHPDLAGKAAVADELTPESKDEQASAGLDRLTPEEYEAFTRMNRAYRERFGFPMIVCVREHTKQSILENAEARLENSREEEVEIALGEIAKIVCLRLWELVEVDPDKASQKTGGRQARRR